MNRPMMIKVGDIVRIKTFEELLNEFELDGDGDIDVSCDMESFLKEMKHLGGLMIRIEEDEYQQFSKKEIANIDGWTITESMVSLVDMKY